MVWRWLSTPVWSAACWPGRCRLDAVSFGPELLDIHSPRERLGVASVERMYQLVCEILKNCR